MSDLVWYFAYGSNMQLETLEGRRGITPRRKLVARLSGWQLVFDKPPLLPIGEAMANVVPASGAYVLGVAYAITRKDLEHIDFTEGVLIGNYHRVAVRVAPLGPEAGTIDAFTLTSERRDPSLQPSRRYMALLIEGALAHGLPVEYLDWLRSIPAIDETPQATAARALLDGIFKKEPR